MQLATRCLAVLQSPANLPFGTSIGGPPANWRGSASNACKRIQLAAIRRPPRLADDLERFTLGQQTQAAAEEGSLVPRIVLGSILACCFFVAAARS